MSSPLSWSGLEELEPCLRAYLKRRCRDRSEIDDVVQETLLRAARYRGSLTDTGRMRGWATRIAGNVLRDHIRRECRLRRTELTEEGLDHLVARESVPGAVPVAGGVSRMRVGRGMHDTEDLLSHMSIALEGLRVEDRRVLRSYYAGDQSCRTTAQECGIPFSLVKVRLFRARRRLAREIRRRMMRGDKLTEQMGSRVGARAGGGA